jgi:hypothetical protein
LELITEPAVSPVFTWLQEAPGEALTVGSKAPPATRTAPSAASTAAIALCTE